MKSQASLTLFHAFLLSSAFLKFSIAADTLGPNQSLSAGETLVSTSQKFELGFFYPGTSENMYLGIWYVKFPDTVVWVANRNNPITDSKGVLTITSNNTLVLLNGNHSIIWSSSSSSAVARKKPFAKLLDSGNFLLIDTEKPDSNTYIWQSFDYPGDTQLPGMKLGQNLHLTSWKTAEDPSVGEFTYVIENYGLPQKVINMGSMKKYRSGPWNGLRFSGLPRATTPDKQPIMEFDENKLISLSLPNNPLIKRTILSQSGFLQHYGLNEKSSSWELMYTAPNDLCDNYGHCGPNGICRSKGTPCQCLKGFTPKSQQEWEVLNWSNGCVRSVSLDCQKGEGFVKVVHVKLPDLLEIQLNTRMSLKDCARECLKNCSCTAYANSNISEGGSGCLMWHGDLIDTREFFQEGSEQDIYIRLPASAMESINNSKSTKRLVKIIVLSAISAIISLGMVCSCIIMKRKTNRRGVKGESMELPLFDLATIAAATRNFSNKHLIGEGGFGPVYKGILSTNQEIAVKRLSKSSGQGLEEFKNEVASIAKLQHRNLVRLLGCCIEGEERMLIYEYMCNKSLDYFIYDPNRNVLLAWQKRLDIIMGIARGLLYLHQDSRVRVIHRDLKVSNILLDSDLTPKISDFGLARIVNGEQIFAQTKRIIGTYGYMSPEYAIDGQFSVKSDVFSFGVILLEVVSGKRNRGFHHPDHHHSLLGHAWLLWNAERSLELMDTVLKESCIESQVQRCIQLGLLCVQKHMEDRPSMSSVVSLLGNDEAKLPQPKQPGYFTERGSIDIDNASGGGEFYTNNVATITILEAR